MKITPFAKERKKITDSISRNKKLRDLGLDFVTESTKNKYNYNFDWLGRPIIQLPEDIMAIQEIIWRLKPNLIIETGIAHGGSLILSASILELMGGKGKVLGVDVDIREHNKKAIEKHPLSKRISMIQGSSIDQTVVNAVKKAAQGKKTVMVILDSNHTHDHVLQELKSYSPLVTKNSYMVVFDTIIEYVRKGTIIDRPWTKGSNPATAVKQFLRSNKNFKVDKEMEQKLLTTCARGGYLKRIK